MMTTMPSRGQVTPEEHASHHPEGPPSGAPGPPSDRPGPLAAAPGPATGPGGDMGGMMERMGAPVPQELYPQLMSLPDLSVDERTAIERQAH